MFSFFSISELILLSVIILDHPTLSFSLTLKEPELQFIQVIKVMGKAANGIQYYITGEAKFPISKRPSTFQAVMQTGVKGTEVRSFRFVSDLQKDPWVWVGHLCSCCHHV